jgi:polyisoprenoid-binding protein YceI
MSVVKGTGGMKALDSDDMNGIKQTIDQEVLKGTAIAFRSTAVEASGDGGLRVTGDLELAGGNNPVSFELDLDDGHVTGSAVVKQSAWGMKPYTALFGTLKVADEVTVSIDAQLQPAG